MRELLDGPRARPPDGGSLDRRPGRRHPALRGRDDPDARRRRPARELREGGFEPVGELGELAVPETLHALDRGAARRPRAGGSSAGPGCRRARPELHAGRPGGGVRTRPRRLVDAASRARPGGPAHRGARPAVTRARPVRVRAGADPRGRLQHALARDRRSRHLAAARFFESLGDDELAGALAAHYLAAFRATTDRRGGSAARHPGAARAARRGGARRGARQRPAGDRLPRPGARRRDRGPGASRPPRGIVQAAWTAGEYENALELAPELRRLRESMGDRSGRPSQPRSSPRRCTRRASATRPSSSRPKRSRPSRTCPTIRTFCGSWATSHLPPRSPGTTTSPALCRIERSRVRSAWACPSSQPGCCRSRARSRSSKGASGRPRR